MTIENLMWELFRRSESGAKHDYRDTCDTLKCGNPHVELHKVAVTMFPTLDVLKKVAAWGAELLIVHEPLFYDHFDVKMTDDPVTQAKSELLERSGLAVWRYHDHAHYRKYDLIAEGLVRDLELAGEWLSSPFGPRLRYRLNRETTPRELAGLFERKHLAAHVRIAGNADGRCRTVSFCCGASGRGFDELRSGASDAVITGETCEWKVAEYARDAAAFGKKCALIVAGHVPTEEGGMRLLAERLREEFSEFETRYWETGEVYSYSDTPVSAQNNGEKGAR